MLPAVVKIASDHIQRYRDLGATVIYCCGEHYRPMLALHIFVVDQTMESLTVLVRGVANCSI